MVATAIACFHGVPTAFGSVHPGSSCSDGDWRNAPGIYLQDRGSRRIVPAVDGAGFAAVQMGSIASEGDQVNHGEHNSTAP